MKTTPSKSLIGLTFLGVFTEVVVCIWSVVKYHKSALWVVPVLLCAYHAGYLLARVWIVRAAGSVLSFVLFIAMIGISYAALASSWRAMAIAVLVYSTCLQAIRSILKRSASVASYEKNIAKGMAMIAGSAGALSSIPLAFILTIAACISLFFAWRASPTNVSRPVNVLGTKRRDLLWFELLHHAHYFAYSYTFWVILNPKLFRWIGVLFPVGWIGYWILERLFRESSNLYSKELLILGHLCCAGALAAMLFTDKSIIILLLWFVTGIGGGTAYMLGNVTNAGNRELYEDVGHVVGCVAAAIAISFSGAATASIIAGIIFAILASSVLLIPGTTDFKWRMTSGCA